MIKNEENKGGIGSDIINNSYEFSSHIPTSPKKIRKDAKGNLIIKKKFPIKKTKHHAHLIDIIDNNQELVNIIDIESYKQYNLDEPIEEEGEKDEDKKGEKVEESKVVVSQGCCTIF